MHIIVETVETSAEELSYIEPAFNRTNTEESVRHFSVYVCVYHFSPVNCKSVCVLVFLDINKK